MKRRPSSLGWLVLLAALLLLAGVQLRSMDFAVSHLNLNKRRAVVLPARRLQHSRAERVLVRVSKLVDDQPVFKGRNSTETRLQQLWREGLLQDSIKVENCTGAYCQPAKCGFSAERAKEGELLDKIQIDSERLLDPDTLLTDTSERILCLTYTVEFKHGNNLQAVRQTWAKRCHGWLAFSNVTDPSIPSIALPQLGPESWGNMWQKTRSIWMHVAEHYVADYDWFFIAGDDTYVIVENLRDYLASPEVQAARKAGPGVYLGQRFWQNGNTNTSGVSADDTPLFNSGGAGAVLDAAAVRALGDLLPGPVCNPQLTVSAEDVMVAKCLAHAGIVPLDTRDALGSQRFNPFNPETHMWWWPDPNDWYTTYNPQAKMGTDCCSVDSVSFHYLPQLPMLEVHNYLYNC